MRVFHLLAVCCVSSSECCDDVWIVCILSLTLSTNPAAVSLGAAFRHEPLVDVDHKHLD